ncbi:MAG TPA: adenylosuccinate synthetase, partial [Flavobacteriales bacterium]|nr:adenylosuccinate synthetase [Flavobacteriales bacterium]
ASKGNEKIGSTLKGIGPTYMDKTGRNGFRVGDLERSDRDNRYAALVKKHEHLLSLYSTTIAWKEAEKEWQDAASRLRDLRIVDSEHWLDERLRAGDRVLAEGAQGTLLDIDFGTYPFVTSSSTISAGACTGLGIGPGSIGKVIGIFKAYSTRVGSGPFPTELMDATGEHIRQAGREFGSTTGRPRRCGWLDLPALRYAVMINGVTELAMMKADVLCGMDRVKLCNSYRVNGIVTDRVPYDLSTGVEPVYETMPGWGDISSELPPALNAYVEHIERAVGVPVRIVSTGPDRAQTLLREGVGAAH